jgi:hypothetical protein
MGVLNAATSNSALTSGIDLVLPPRRHWAKREQGSGQGAQRSLGKLYPYGYLISKAERAAEGRPPDHSSAQWHGYE